MSFEPNYLVWIAPGADATTLEPAWVDISADLKAVDYGRGSPKELTRNDPGTGTVVLDNYLGTYDNENSGSPYAGNLVPMLRIKVIAEWEGELYPAADGYLDSIQLTYPTDNDAVATFRFTDGFKPLAATDLPVSPYAADVATDLPLHWWRLDEPVGSLTVFDSAGSLHAAAIGTPTLGSPGLVTHDPGTAALLDSDADGFTVSGLTDVGAGTGSAFTLEAVVKTTSTPVNAKDILHLLGGSGNHAGILLVGSGDVTNVGKVWFSVQGGATFENVYSAVRIDDGIAHHVAATQTAAGARKIYIDGVDVTGTTSPTVLSLDTTQTVGLGNQTGTSGFPGTIDELALYASALSAARVAAHAGARSTPWNGDTPGARAARIADIVGWPAGLRDFDAGSSVLQSADLGQTALEHLQKVAESEFGELFVSGDGTLTLRSRTAPLNRGPLATFGDAASEISYRDLTFDESDELIRNPVTISRENGVAQTATDTAKVRKYYPHTFTIDGLYHNSDALSLSAAQFFLSEYKDPKRRINGLMLGPARDDARYDLYPLVLTLELGDVVAVTFRPPNADSFSQTSIIEGLRHAWTPVDGHTCEFDLSPTYAGAFLQLDNANVTIEGANPGRLFF